MKETAKHLLQLLGTIVFWNLPVSILVTLGVLVCKTAAEEIKDELKHF